MLFRSLVKTYCKPADVNVEDLEFIRQQVHLCFIGKRSKGRFQKLLISTEMCIRDSYDTMSKLDADFSGWLRANQAQFPKTIWQLVQLACQRAGVTLAGISLPINGCLLYTSRCV